MTTDTEEKKIEDKINEIRGKLNMPPKDFSQEDWLPIETAPKDGTVIEVNYGTADNPQEVCTAFWSDKPICMLGPRNGTFPPGWATSGYECDKNLPLDPPNFWRPI